MSVHHKPIVLWYQAGHVDTLGIKCGSRSDTEHMIFTLWNVELQSWEGGGRGRKKKENKGGCSLLKEPWEKTNRIKVASDTLPLIHALSGISWCA